MNLDTLLRKISNTIAGHFKSDIGLCDIHPGMLTPKEQNNLKNYSPIVYTTVTDFLSVETIDSGEVKNNIQFLSLFLVYNRTAKERDSTIRDLVLRMTDLLVTQKWRQKYTFPPEDIKAFDLHGLLRNPNEVMGTQGWNPTLQARANDLFGKMDEDKDPQFSIWAITWEQGVVYAPKPEYLDYSVKIHNVNGRDAVLPDVFSLKLENWRVEEFKNRGRLLNGTVVINTDVKDSLLISKFRLFWGDKNGRRMTGSSVIGEFDNGEELKFKLPVDLVVPSGASQILAVGRSSQGVSQKMAGFRLTGYWYSGQNLNKPRANHCKFITDDYPVVIGGVSDEGRIMSPEMLPVVRPTSIDFPELPLYFNRLYGAGTIDRDGYILAGSEHKSSIFRFLLAFKECEDLNLDIPDNYRVICAAIAGKMFCAITSDNDGYSNEMLICNLKPTNGEERKWQSSGKGTSPTIPKSPGFRRKLFSLCGNYNRLFVTGGVNDKSEPIKNVNVYNISLNRWSPIPDMPVALSNVTTVADLEKLYVFGGKDEDGEVVNSVFCFDFETEIWHSMDYLNCSRHSASAVFYRGNIHISGGFGANECFLNTMEIYTLEY